MKIAWLTDIHLNFLKVEARKKFYQQVIKTGADRILITGDIAEAKDVCEILHTSASGSAPFMFMRLPRQGERVKKSEYTEHSAAASRLSCLP